MIEITAPTVEDVMQLSEVAFVSKAYWGYSKEFMEQCRGELTVSPGDISADLVRVAKLNEEIAGFYKLSGSAPAGELEMLFVRPSHIGLGIGRILLESAKRQASKIGMDELLIDSDPNAEDFYLHMGAVKIDESPSGSIAGRMLPRLIISTHE